MRHTKMLAVQTGGRLLLQAASSNGLLPEGGELSQQQRLLFGGISVGLTVLAGLMSGLTLGLMSLDAVELEVLKRSGSSREKQYAAAIAPLIQNTHFLLVTLLLCNACAMEALPLFLDTLTDPATAILVSVTAVLVFGEVLPQAVCSRYGLAIGYYCSWLVRALMAATSPISWPLGRLLDWMLGAEHTALYRRGQLKALVDIHAADEGLGGPLLADEIKVMVGALDLTHKTAATSMTPLAKVLMLPAEARYDAALLAQVLDSGHSRLPVFTGGDRRSIVGLVLVKDLLRHAPDGSVALGQLQMRPLPRVPADTPMYDMFKLFQTGRSHMVLLTEPPAAQAAATADSTHPAAAAAAAAAAAGAPFSPRPALLGSGDASGLPLGIITIEDVIEELMQTEIVDETDLFVDNEQSISVNASSMMQGLPAQLRSALAQQHHHTHNQQHQQYSAPLAGAADAGAPVSAAAAAAAVSTMRKLVRKVSSRSREHGSSGGGATSTPSASLAPGGESGGAAAAAAAAPRVSDSSTQVISHDNDHTQPLLSHDRS